MPTFYILFIITQCVERTYYLSGTDDDGGRALRLYPHFVYFSTFFHRGQDVPLSPVSPPYLLPVRYYWCSVDMWFFVRTKGILRKKPKGRV